MNSGSFISMSLVVVLGVGFLEDEVGLRALLRPLAGLVDEGATTLDTESVEVVVVVVVGFLDLVDLVTLGSSSSSTVFSKVTAGELTETLVRLFDDDVDVVA